MTVPVMAKSDLADVDQFCEGSTCFAWPRYVGAVRSLRTAWFAATQEITRLKQQITASENNAINTLAAMQDKLDEATAKAAEDADRIAALLMRLDHIHEVSRPETVKPKPSEHLMASQEHTHGDKGIDPKPHLPTETMEP